jgi:hypothetical protein
MASLQPPLAGSTTTATGAPTQGIVASEARHQRKEATMDEQEVRELFFERLQHLSAEAEYELRHPDYVMEMPQSGERIRGRDNMRAFQEAYPNPPTIQPRRVVGSGNVWVIEARSDYGGQIYHVAMIVEFRDGKIWRDTRYYAEPFEAPEWRAEWVERMEEPPAPAAASA